MCSSTSLGTAVTGVLRSTIAESTRKEHGHKRRAIRALLSDKDEVGGAPAGMRRFRSVKGDEETLLDVDDENELLRMQETRSPKSHTKATLTWKVHGDRFVRERMEIDGDEIRDGRRFPNKAIVILEDVRFNPSVRP